MKNIERGAIAAAGLVLISSLSFLGVASAYSLNQSTTGQTPNAVNLPQLPAGTFNLNWAGFFNSLPIQNFIASLKSTNNGVGNASMQSGTPNMTAGTGKMFLQQIDNWTSSHLGFRFSELFGAVLGVLSWILGFAKSIVDWFLSFIR
jgi:hypothetical protein